MGTVSGTYPLTGGDGEALLMTYAPTGLTGFKLNTRICFCFQQAQEAPKTMVVKVRDHFGKQVTSLNSLF